MNLQLAFAIIEGAVYAFVAHYYLVGRPIRIGKAIVLGFAAAMMLFLGGFLRWHFPYKAVLFVLLLSALAQLLYRARLYIVTFLTVGIFYLHILFELMLNNSMGVNHIMFNLQSSQSLTPLDGAVSLLAVCLQVFVCLRPGKSFMRLYIRNPKEYWVILDVMAFLSFFLVACLAQAQNVLRQAYTPLGVALPNYCFVAINALIALQFVQLSKKNQREIEVLAQESLSQKITEDLVYLGKIQDEFSQIRHEWNNHLSALGIYLKEGMVDDALDYLAAINLSIPNYRIQNYTGNDRIDLIINAKLDLAASRGITVALEISPIGKLSIPAEDIVSVIANLVDNALEATENLNEQDRKINLSCKCVNQYLIVEVKNLYNHEPNESNGQLLSSKRDPNSHGLGLSIVRHVCTRNSGALDISFGNGVFYARATLFFEEN